jgi:cytochrome c556
MIRPTPFCAALVLGTVLSTTSAYADDQDVIDYRTHVMKTLEEQTEAIKMIIAKKAPADNLATHVKTLAIAAGMAKKAFEPKVEGGASKPQVWSNWPDFSKQLDALTAATGELSKAATDGGVASVAPKFQSALNCQGCHDQYVVTKK